MNSKQFYHWKLSSEVTYKIQPYLSQNILNNQNSIPKRNSELWENRLLRLFVKINNFQPIMRLRAEKLIPVYCHRRSLTLKLTDKYLKVIWGNSSRATVQRTLDYFEKNNLIKRFTEKPRLKDGLWQQQRFISLIIPPQKTKNICSETYKHNNHLKRWRENGVLITDEQYKRHIDTKCCDLCGIQFSNLVHRHKHMDHCHETGEYRGTLCMPCNAITLGRLGDNLELVLSKIKNYKEQFEGSL